MQKTLSLAGALVLLTFPIGATPNLAEAGQIPRLVAPPAGTTLVQTYPAETSLRVADIPEAHAVWLQAIQSARKEIRLEQFYVANRPNSRLETIIQALEKKGAEGVRIKVLLDQTMIQNDRASFERLNAIPNAEVRAYPLKQINGGIVHQKSITVDGEWLFIGSHNFDWRALEQIHEMGIAMKDRAVTRQLDAIFDIDWEIARTGKLPTPQPTQRKLPRPANGQPQLVGSPPELLPRGMTPALDALLELIGGARESIEIQLMDFSTRRYSSPSAQWPVLDDALKAAARRGVKIRLLVSDWNTPEPGLSTLKSLAATPGIEVSVCTIPQHSEGFQPYSRVIHSKYMVVDQRTLWLGTSNWGHGYFLGSRNVELIFRNSTLAPQAQGVFEHVWRQPITARVHQGSRFPPPRKEH